MFFMFKNCFRTLTFYYVATLLQDVNCIFLKKYVKYYNKYPNVRLEHS